MFLAHHKITVIIHPSLYVFHEINEWSMFNIGIFMSSSCEVIITIVKNASKSVKLRIIGAPPKKRFPLNILGWGVQETFKNQS